MYICNDGIFENPVQFSLDTNSIKKNFDIHSVKRIIGTSQDLLIYGYKESLYEDVSNQISELKALINIQNVYIYNHFSCSSPKTNDRFIEKIAIPLCPSPMKLMKRFCKSGIPQLVLENYKRIRENIPPLTLLFCIDRDDNPIEFDESAIANKTPYAMRHGEKLLLNDSFTHAEIRRVFKIVELESSPEEELREMAAIAIKYIKFVKVCIDRQNQTFIIEIPAPWLSLKFKAAWQQRHQFRQLQEQFVSLEMQARLLESLGQESKEDDENLVLQEVEDRNIAAQAARKAADVFFEVYIEPIMPEKERSFRQKKSLGEQWQPQLLKNARDFNLKIS